VSFSSLVFDDRVTLRVCVRACVHAHILLLESSDLYKEQSEIYALYIST